VFRINTDGAGFTNLHSFTMDAYDCNAGLILSSNTLFGATIEGHNRGERAVFKINTDGTGFTNLYRFTGGNDGAYAGATLALTGNTLYGSTGRGGSSTNGVIFKVHTDGTGFGVLYDFPVTTFGTNVAGANPAWLCQGICCTGRQPTAAAQAMGRCSVFSSCPNWQSLLQPRM